MGVSIDAINEASTFALSQLMFAAVFGVVLVVCAAALLGSLSTVSAATRHWIWLLVIVFPILLPVCLQLLPQWNVIPNQLTWVAPTSLEAEDQTSQSLIRKSISGVSPVDLTTTTTGNASATRGHHHLSRSSVVFLAWLVGVVVSLMFWTLGIVNLWHLANQANALDHRSAHEHLKDAIGGLGISRRVRLLVSDQCAMPMQWGIMRPTVMLPAAASQWDVGTVKRVLAHELAHIVRNDCVTQAIAYFARSLLWFNPLSWYACGQLHRECEHACDDVVLHDGCDACDYADTLLFVTATVQKRPTVGIPAMGMAYPSMLERRVHAILAQNNNRGRVSPLTVTALAIGFGIILSATAMLRCEPAKANGALMTRVLTQANDRSPDNTMKLRPQSDLVLRLSHVDDSAEGRRSIADSGHAVRFEREVSSEGVAANHLVATEIFASRYGYPTPPEEDFHIYVLDDQKKLIAAFPVPYAMIERGTERWYTIPITATAIPEQFYVAVVFDPHRTKGIYLGYDESNNQTHSLVGRPTTGFEELKDRKDWMIRAITTTKPALVNPFE